MLARLRKHLSYANVMASIALFVALGGSSYAAITLSNNSVKSKHIGEGQVKRSDVGKDAVTSAKVKNFSLLANDFKAGEIPPGPAGAPGAKGDKGDKGDPGAPGATNVILRTQDFVANPNNQGGGTVNCRAGERATGGGWSVVSGDNRDVARHGNRPSPNTNGVVPTGWSMTFFHVSASMNPVTVRVYVICASP